MFPSTWKFLESRGILVLLDFSQRGRVACNAQRCNTYSNSVCPSVCHTLVPYPDE